MKVYRKDKLYTSDKEKCELLTDVLRGVRISDEAAFFAGPAKQKTFQNKEKQVTPPQSPDSKQTSVLQKAGSRAGDSVQK